MHTKGLPRLYVMSSDHGSFRDGIVDSRVIFRVDMGFNIYRDDNQALAKVLIQNPCPFGQPDLPIY